MNYWQSRMAKAQDKLTATKAKDIDEQIAKYYAKSMEKVITIEGIDYFVKRNCG